MLYDRGKNYFGMEFSVFTATSAQDHLLKEEVALWR
jgi:hypothetical protein